MRITYHQDVDILRIVLNGSDIEESDENRTGVIIDYDEQGNVVGMEILDVSRRKENSKAIDYAVTG